MIKDITFGQYYSAFSIIHKLDPRLKLLLLVAYILLVFISNNWITLSFVTIILICIMILSLVPIKVYLKNLKVILPIILFTSILNALYVNDGSLILSFWIIKIYDQGIYRALFMSIRIVLLVLAGSLLSYTTTPTELTDSIENLFSPLKFFGLSNAVHSLAMMMTIALRFIPTLIEETDKIMSAQKARGASLDNGGLISKVKALIPILIPLLISSIRRAYELAEAMESRCYNGGEGRVRMKKLKFSFKDYLSSIFFVIAFIVVIILNIMF